MQEIKKKKKIHGSGTTMLIISNEEINDIIKFFKLLKVQIFYWKESLKQFKMRQGTKRMIFKHVIRYFRRLLWNMLAGKGIIRAGSGNKKRKGIVRAGFGNEKGKGIVRAVYGNEIDF